MEESKNETKCMDDILKARTLIACALIFSSAWAFNSWMDFRTVEVQSEAQKEIVTQQEKTKRLISYDTRCAGNAECKPISVNQ